MPPKAKFTKQQVIQAAVDLVREKGIDAVTARELGSKLGSSARPVFTVFKNMEEVISEVSRAARNCYNAYIAQGLKEKIAFKGVGRAYIRFAANEPNLFRMLFMEENNAAISEILPVIDENYSKILQSITSGYGVGNETAVKLYRHLWIYSHGIAVMLATHACELSSEQIDEMLTEVFIALLKSHNCGGLYDLCR